MRGLPPPLIALSPGDLDRVGPADFVAAAVPALAAGTCGLLLREPGMSDRAFLELACELRERLPGAWLALHDRAHLVHAAGAQAVHLGFRSLPPPAARTVVGPDVALGFSAHAHDAAGARAGADYVFFGPVLDTPSKRGRLEPVGFEGLARECAREALPLWALGGLQPDHAAPVLRAGARGLAVRAGVFGQADPARAVERYLAAWSRAASEEAG